MPERLPSLYPMPRDEVQYATIFRLAQRKLPKDEFSLQFGAHVTKKEDGQPYGKMMQDRLIANLLGAGFLVTEDEVIGLPKHSSSAPHLTNDYFRKVIKTWGRLYPSGLRFAIELLGVASGQAQTAAEMLSRLTASDTGAPAHYDGRDTTASRTIREFLKLLWLAGWITQDGSTYTKNEATKKARSTLLNFDAATRAERVLIKTDPGTSTFLTPDVKAAIAKDYVFRQSGGAYHEQSLGQLVHKALFKSSTDDTKTPRLKDEAADEEKAHAAEKNRLLSIIEFRAPALLEQSRKIRRLDKLREIAGALEQQDGQRAQDLLFDENPVWSPKDLAKIAHGQPYHMRAGVKPHEWQLEALDRWESKGRRGVLAVVTGGGKTVFALQAIERLLVQETAAHVTILVPTRVLMFQWARELVRLLGVPVKDVGLRGDRFKDSHAAGKRVLVCVINSAIQDGFLAGDIMALPPSTAHLLVADECHRYAGDKFKDAFQARADFTLGLSATPAAEGETIDDGNILTEALGPVFYRYTYKQALEQEIVQPFVVRYCAVDLMPHERASYEDFSKKIRKALEKIRSRYGPRLDAMRGHSLDQKLQTLIKDDNPDPAIGEYFANVRERKRLIHNAINRKRCYLDLIHNHTVRRTGDKVIVFHERIEQLEEIVAPQDQRRRFVEDDKLESTDELKAQKYEEFPEEAAVDQQLVKLFKRPEFRPVMYHSGHAKLVWNQIGMEFFRQNVANVMLSVKALVEGVDVPAANVGIIRSSSSSVRQRIQTTGRILRKAATKTEPSRLYVIYVRDTTDERIFREMDWQAELGSQAVECMYWQPNPDANEIEGTWTNIDLPKVEKREDDSWKPTDVTNVKIGDLYPGKYAGIELHVDASGATYRNTRDGRRFIRNPEIKVAADHVRRLKGGGKVVLTPQNHILTKKGREVIYLGTTSDLDYDPPAKRSAKGASFDDLLKALRPVTDTKSRSGDDE